MGSRDIIDELTCRPALITTDVYYIGKDHRRERVILT